MLRQAEALFPEFPSCAQPRSIERKSPQTHQRREELRAFPYLLAECLRPGVDVFDFRSRIALDDPER